MSTPAYTAYFGGVAGQAHNEAAFRHFLNIERKRAERAAQSVLLILVSMRSSPGRNARLAPAKAAAVFFALGESVREADFIGWYWEDRVAAAVLTHHPAPLGEIGPRVTGRVSGALGNVPLGGGAPFRIRAVPLRGQARA